MAIKDYRLDPFLNVINIKKITGEYHQVPNQSPYTIRLNEVPQKTDPTSLNICFADAAVLTEVAAQPAQGQYWPDYNTTAHGVADWNTGTILFNAADAGKIIYASYNGIGTLVDDRSSGYAGAGGYDKYAAGKRYCMFGECRKLRFYRNLRWR